MIELVWSEQAKFDLQNIYDFIAEDSIYYADLEIVKITSATDILFKQPKAGKVVAELMNDSIREVIYGNYRIIYRIKQSTLTILTVHHGARLFKPSNL